MAEYVPKITHLRDAMRRGDWRAANAIAAKFGRLGAYRDRILDAREAYCRPQFQVALGRDPQRLIDDGIAALKEAYGDSA